jgi:hypothetical protein
METIFSVVSLFGSIVSGVMTAYFWLVRVRNERPNIRLVLSRCHFETSTRRENDRFLNVRIELIAANYSVLPNAILRAILRWKTREGTWEVRPLSTPPMPINLPPSQTALLTFTGMVKMAHADVVEKSDKNIEIVSSHLAHTFNDPLQFQVELRTLEAAPTFTELHPEWTAA